MCFSDQSIQSIAITKSITQSGHHITNKRFTKYNSCLLEKSKFLFKRHKNLPQKKLKHLASGNAEKLVIWSRSSLLRKEPTPSLRGFWLSRFRKRRETCYLVALFFAAQRTNAFASRLLVISLPMGRSIYIKRPRFPKSGQSLPHSEEV